MLYLTWVNIEPGKGLVPDGTKPLPDPMLIYHLIRSFLSNISYCNFDGCVFDFKYWNLYLKMICLLKSDSQFFQGPIFRGIIVPMDEWNWVIIGSANGMLPFSNQPMT